MGGERKSGRKVKGKMYILKPRILVIFLTDLINL